MVFVQDMHSSRLYPYYDLEEGEIIEDEDVAEKYETSFMDVPQNLFEDIEVLSESGKAENRLNSHDTKESHYGSAYQSRNYIPKHSSGAKSRVKSVNKKLDSKSESNQTVEPKSKKYKRTKRSSTSSSSVSECSCSSCSCTTTSSEKSRKSPSLKDEHPVSKDSGRHSNESGYASKAQHLELKTENLQPQVTSSSLQKNVYSSRYSENRSRNFKSVKPYPLHQNEYSRENIKSGRERESRHKQRSTKNYFKPDSTARKKDDTHSHNYLSSPEKYSISGYSDSRKSSKSTEDVVFKDDQNSLKSKLVPGSLGEMLLKNKLNSLLQRSISNPKSVTSILDIYSQNSEKEIIDLCFQKEKDDEEDELTLRYNALKSAVKTCGSTINFKADFEKIMGMAKISEKMLNMESKIKESLGSQQIAATEEETNDGFSVLNEEMVKSKSEIDTIDMEISNDSLNDSYLFDEGKQGKTDRKSSRMKSLLPEEEKQVFEEIKHYSHFPFPVEWAYMIPPPTHPGEPDNNLNSVSSWCYNQNMYVQSMKEPSSEEKEKVMNPIEMTQPSFNHHTSTSEFTCQSTSITGTKDSQNIHEPNQRSCSQEVSDYLSSQELQQAGLRDSHAEQYQSFMSNVINKNCSGYFTPQTQHRDLVEIKCTPFVKSKTQRTLTNINFKTSNQYPTNRPKRKVRRRRKSTKKTDSLKNAQLPKSYSNGTNNVSSGLSDAKDTPSMKSVHHSSDKELTNENSISEDDEDILRAQLLNDMARKNKDFMTTSSAKSESKPSEKNTTIPHPLPSLKRKIPPKSQVTTDKEQRKWIKNDRGLKTNVYRRPVKIKQQLDIGGRYLDPKNRFFDAPLPREFSLAKFPAIKPVIIKLNNESDSECNEPHCSTQPRTENNSCDNVISGIYELIKSCRNKQAKTEKIEKPNVKTPKAMGHLSKERQEEYRKLRELLASKKKVIQQRKAAAAHPMLKHPQNKDFESSGDLHKTSLVKKCNSKSDKIGTFVKENESYQHHNPEEPVMKSALEKLGPKNISRNPISIEKEEIKSHTGMDSVGISNILEVEIYDTQTSVSEIDNNVTTISETDVNLTLESGTDSNINSVSKIDDDITSVSETDNKISPVSEPDNNIIPVSETNVNIISVSEIDKDILEKNENLTSTLLMDVSTLDAHLPSVTFQPEPVLINSNSPNAAADADALQDVSSTVQGDSLANCNDSDLPESICDLSDAVNQPPPHSTSLVVNHVSADPTTDLEVNDKDLNEVSKNDDKINSSISITEDEDGDSSSSSDSSLSSSSSSEDSSSDSEGNQIEINLRNKLLQKRRQLLLNNNKSTINNVARDESAENNKKAEENNDDQCTSKINLKAMVIDESFTHTIRENQSETCHLKNTTDYGLTEAQLSTNSLTSHDETEGLQLPKTTVTVSGSEDAGNRGNDTATSSALSDTDHVACSKAKTKVLKNETGSRNKPPNELSQSPLKSSTTVGSLMKSLQSANLIRGEHKKYLKNQIQEEIKKRDLSKQMIMSRIASLLNEALSDVDTCEKLHNQILQFLQQITASRDERKKKMGNVSVNVTKAVKLIKKLDEDLHTLTALDKLGLQISDVEDTAATTTGPSAADLEERRRLVQQTKAIQQNIRLSKAQDDSISKAFFIDSSSPSRIRPRVKGKRDFAAPTQGLLRSPLMKFKVDHRPPPLNQCRGPPSEGVTHSTTVGVSPSKQFRQSPQIRKLTEGRVNRKDSQDSPALPLRKDVKSVEEFDVLCPHDLLGRCNDDSCVYQHTSMSGQVREAIQSHLEIDSTTKGTMETQSKQSINCPKFVENVSSSQSSSSNIIPREVAVSSSSLSHDEIEQQTESSGNVPPVSDPSDTLEQSAYIVDVTGDESQTESTLTAAEPNSKTTDRSTSYSSNGLESVPMGWNSMDCSVDQDVIPRSPDVLSNDDRVITLPQSPETTPPEDVGSTVSSSVVPSLNPDPANVSARRRRPRRHSRQSCSFHPIRTSRRIQEKLKKTKE